MTFAFATLAFLTAAWLAAVVLATTLEDQWAKVRAAINGEPATALPAITLRLRPRYPTARPVRLRARPALRAAA